MARTTHIHNTVGLRWRCRKMLCSRLAPCCHTRAAVAALAHLSGAALHAAPRRAFGAGSSPPSGSGAAAAGGRAAHVCRSYADPEVYSIAFNFRKFDQEVNELRSAHQWQHCPLCDPPTGIAASLQVAHLLAMHQKHCSGALQHFLEVACGPAQVGQTGVPLVMPMQLVPGASSVPLSLSCRQPVRLPPHVFTQLAACPSVCSTPSC